MKKVVFFCLLSIAAMGLTGCRDCTCQHGPTQDCYYHAQTLDLTVNPNQWVYDAGLGQFYCTFDVPDITANVYNYGTFNLFREYNSGTKNAYQVSLPETTYLSAEEDNGDGTKNIVYYQQHVDYAVGIGIVEVFLTISDFYYTNFTPEAMHFRLQLIY